METCPEPGSSGEEGQQAEEVGVFRNWSDADDDGIRLWVQERGGRSGGWKELAEAWASRGLSSPAPTEAQIATRWQRHVSPKAEKKKAEKASQPSERRPNKRRGREPEEPEKGKPSKRRAIQRPQPQPQL